MLGTVPRDLVVLLMALTAIKLGFELKKSENAELKRSFKLQWGQLRSWTAARYVCGVMGGFILPGILLLGVSFPGLVAIAAFSFRLVGELLERHLFFTAVAPPKMPGGVA
jgi:DMSO reductase anchor subunit